jgi:benzodiazapine receptor
VPDRLLRRILLTFGWKTIYPDTCCIYKTLHFRSSPYENVNRAAIPVSDAEREILGAMAITVNTQDRMRSLLVIVATVATIIFNGLAATGYVNQISPAEVSAKYPTVLTPAGYAFTIWTLIYVGLIAFSIYQALPSNLSRFRPVRSLYIVSCLLNCVWIYFWHREQIGICLAVILTLCVSLWFIRYKLKPFDSPGDVWLVNTPFGIYAGWVTAAAIVNFLVLLTYLRMGLSASGENLLAVTLIAVATGAAVIARITLRDFFFPLAVAWALTAIAVKQSGNTAIVVATAVGVVACIITGGSVVTELKDSSSE